MIERLLIANRGEIACRIARTARRMGITVVGVYSDPDATARHVEAVDFAVALGGSSPADSYLRADALIDAAQRTGCDAVHPGYGFLAESADFAQRVIDAGLVWVGPTPDQIALLGDKVAAKKTAAGAGVPSVPVYDPAAIPDDLPLPVVVKAAAGGGGRGMRIVRDRGDFAAALTEAERESAAAFGDGTVFVEPYLERARHVEVQIIGDDHGTILHLGERECSIQRRHQKIIEESPSPGIDDEVRAKLWDSAVSLARAVDYRNAGTVEFLVGDDGTIDLLEVNSRLQVEHPVTEAVTGLDLVELQLLVAAGEPLPITQEEVVFSGHAIEARLVAEDPAARWLPSTGEVAAFWIEAGVRVDSGVGPGSIVSSDYDSLLAKVIAHAPTREQAVHRLGRALRGAHLAGPATNRNALVALLDEPDFRAGRTWTSYFDEHPAVVAAGGPGGTDRVVLLLAAAARRQHRNRSADPHWGFVRPGWRNLPTIGQRSAWVDDAGETIEVEEWWDSDVAGRVRVGPWPRPDAEGVVGEDDRADHRIRILGVDDGGVILEVDGVRTGVATTPLSDGRITTTAPFGAETWRLVPRFVDHTAEEAGRGPVSPLPGTVIAVHVEPGAEVEEGDLLMVIEAMKMEHKIVAVARATIATIHFSVGDRVDAGDRLVDFKHED